MNSGIYLHIPFCSSKCGYCDFLSFEDKQDKYEAYTEALICEISDFSKSPKYHGAFNTIKTIYIGGGTPTILPAHLLSKLLGALYTLLPVAKMTDTKITDAKITDAKITAPEISCEANPGTLNSENIEALITGGINRISLGLQALQPRLLNAIGRRAVRFDIFLENFKNLRKVGFNNINIDIMFALPGQSLKDWEETLIKVTELEPEHISAYGLTVEGDQIIPCDEETDRRMYHHCREFLQKRGYIQYELSNFSKVGYESQHNVGYWTRKPCIGFGLGAHSFDGITRWHNTTDLDQYLGHYLGQNKEHYQYQSQNQYQSQYQNQYQNQYQDQHIQQNHSKITITEAMSEFMFLGLRMTKGISISDFAKEFGSPVYDVFGPWINKMENDRLILNDNQYISLTERGMDLANLVMAGFL